MPRSIWGCRRQRIKPAIVTLAGKAYGNKGLPFLKEPASIWYFAAPKGGLLPAAPGRTGPVPFVRNAGFILSFLLRFMTIPTLRRLLTVAALLVSLCTGSHSRAQSTLIQNAPGRRILSLNGRWNYIRLAASMSIS